ncbi:serine/threonine-protein kinase [Nocardia sp. NPDC003963]
MQVGDVIGGYRIERLLGSGGMGSVYLARHPRMPRRVALKTLNDSVGADSEFRARFIREADLAARLSHPNVVAIHDRGVQDECLWIAMQYVSGSDAAQLIEDQPRGLDPYRAVDIVTAAARGLDAAHEAGLLHRDVKPANILVSSSGWVLVTDFGIARDTGASTVLTATGDVLATIAYAAPEQISGETLDHRADVYALGCTLYYLLTGAKPFPRPTPAAVLSAHLNDRPPKPSAVRSELPHGLDIVIAQAMAKAPRDRYPSCGALAADARAALRGELAGARGGGRSVFAKRFPRFRALVTAAALVLALAVASAVYAVTTSGSDVRAAVSPRSITDNGESGPWGVYSHIFDGFPDLLPHTPFASGYRGLRCNPSGAEGFVSLDVRRELQQVFCSGDGDPLEYLYIWCGDNRALYQVGIQEWESPPQEERWSRDTGSGRLFWGTARNSAGGVSGALEILFDDPNRNFCVLHANSYAATGPELRDSWWRDAPI